MQRNQAYTILILITVFLNGLLWSVISPLWQGPDESGHYAAIQFIGESLRLPTAEEAYQPDELTSAKRLIGYDRVATFPGKRQDFGLTSVGPNEASILSLPKELRTSSDYNQQTIPAMTVPPLYHILAAGIYRITHSSSILARGFALRLFSVCCATLAVYVCIRSARAIFPNDHAMQWTLPILFGFHPMFTFLGSVINPGILSILEMTLFTYVGLLVIRDGLNYRRAIALGAILAAGIMTRPEAWTTGLPLVYLFLIEFSRKKTRSIWPILVFSVAVIVGAGWWLIRSSEINQNLIYSSRIQRYVPRTGYYPWHYAIDYANHLWGWLFRTYWGGFGHTMTQLPSYWYDFLRGIVIASAIGIVWCILRQASNLHWDARYLALGFLGLCLASVVVAWGVAGYWHVRAGISPTMQPSKGRYLIGPLMAQMAFLGIGITKPLPKKWRWSAHLFLRAVFLLLNVGALLLVIFPRYYL